MSSGDELTDLAWRKSISEIIPNLLFFGFGVVILVFLAAWIRWLAIVGFAVYGVILVIDLIRLTVVLGTGFQLLVSGRAELKGWGATLVQLVETQFSLYTLAYCTGSCSLHEKMYPSFGEPGLPVGLERSKVVADEHGELLLWFLQDAITETRKRFRKYFAVSA